MLILSKGIASAQTTFTEKTVEGVELKYRVTDEKNCEVTGASYDPQIVTIPTEVRGYNVTSIGSWAFNDCSGLTSVTIPNSVTSIGNYAFDGCSRLTSATIGNSVTSIGSHAFSGCIRLTSFTIPNSVTTIGSGAFSGSGWFNNQPDGILYLDNWLIGFKGEKPTGDFVITEGTKGLAGSAFIGCWDLTSVTIPNSVISIGEDAFSGCSRLTSVTIPNSVTNIGDGAFKGCSSLPSITIPNSVTSIGNRAFSGCSRLTSVTIPNSVTSIGNRAFSGCSGLTSITFHCKKIENWFAGFGSILKIVIGDEVTSIGDHAFSGCSGLVSVAIPNSVTSIGNYAFDGCSSLTSVSIPNSVTSIGARAFYECSRLTSITFHCKKIENWFEGFSSIMEIVIGDGVTSIGYKAFCGCENMTSITISNSVTSIEYGAFWGCSGLPSITIPNSVESIGNSAFSGCFFPSSSFINNSTLTDINNWGATLVDEETEDGLLIKNSTIVKCRQWATSVIIPSTVMSIGVLAFQKCNSMASVTIPNSVTSIGADAFSACSHLVSVHISDLTAWCKIVFNTLESNPLTYANHLYLDGKEITNLVFPNDLERIGGWAFSGCSSLTSVTIPNSVISIGENAFSGCSRLTSVHISDLGKWCGISFEDSYSNPLLYAHHLYMDGKEITELVVPQSMTSIGHYSFEGCSGMTSITIPNSVTSIGDYAFSGCSGLSSVTIPKSVTSIGNYAFEKCRLSEVEVLREDPASSDRTSFDDTTYRSGRLIVPSGSKKRYQAADGWKQFINIEEDKSEEILPNYDLSVIPEDGSEIDSLNTVTLTFNPTEGTPSITVSSAEDAQPTLTNANGNNFLGALSTSGDNKLTVTFKDEEKTPGNYTLTIFKNSIKLNDVALQEDIILHYTIIVYDSIPDVTIIPSSFCIYDNETPTLDFTVAGETEESIRHNYTWFWNDDESTKGQKPYTFNPNNVSPSNIEGSEKQSVTLSIHRLPGGPFKEPTPQAEFIVYPEPQLQFIVDGEKKDNLNSTYSKKKTETLKIEAVPIGGSSDWTYEWKEEDVSLSSEKTCTARYNNNNEHHITLTVTNKLPEQGKEWKSTHEFTVSFTDVAMPTITLKAPNVKQMFSGKSIDVSFELDSTDESVSTDKNDYTWDWMVDGLSLSKNDIFNYTPKTEVSSGSEKQTVSLAITRNADGEKKTESLSFDVFPEPVLYFTQLNVGYKEEPIKDKNESAVMEQNDIWMLQVKPTKGNNDPNKWKYTWTEDGNPFDDANGQYCRIGYNGKEKRTVKLVVKNTLPGEDVEESTGQWEQEYTFIARFKGDMPAIELSGKANDGKAPDNILAGTEVTVDFKLFDVDNNPIDDPSKDYIWKWNDEDYTNDKLTYAFITSNNLKEDSKKNDVKLTLRRTKDNKETDETISFTVWPLPVVTLSWNEGEIKSLTETTQTQTLRVTPTGGYRDGWSVKWTDDEGNEVGNDYEITLKYDDYKARKDEPTPIRFTVSVTNQAKGHNTLWYEKSFNFYIKLTGDVTTTIQAVPNEFNDNYLSNDTITLSHTSSVENLKNVKWTVDDNATVEGADLIFGDVKEKTDVTVTFSADGAPSVQKVFTVWPEPQLKETNWEMAFTDTSNKNNDMAKTGSVREGNVIVLGNIPTLTGGYENDSYAFVRLNGSHTELALNKGQLTINGLTFKNGVYKGIIEYVGGTYYSNKQPMGERVLASYPITVYQKPSAPSSFALKGNGNSGTWYVKGYTPTANSNLVLASDRGNVSIDAHADDWSWIVSKVSSRGAEGRFAVYTEQQYEGNVIITSDKRYAGDSNITPWDGSRYGTAVTSLSPKNVVEGHYNTSGMKISHPVHGLYIIRMGDGTVKKVFGK